MLEYVKILRPGATKARYEPERLFPRADEILYDPNLPAESNARGLRFQFGHMLLRPYSPEGFKDIDCLDGEVRKLYLEKNKKWPRIWGFPLAMTTHDAQRYADIELGNCLLVFRRFADEDLAHDLPDDPRYLGEVLPIQIINLRSLELVITPSPVRIQYR